MTPTQFYKKHTKKEIETLAEAAGTSFANFQQIALAGGSVGKRLAERLALASDGRMTELEILYPERFPESPELVAQVCRSERARVNS